MARRMHGPTLAQLMQARSTGDYAVSTPGEVVPPKHLTEEEVAQLQAEVQATGQPPTPQPVQLAPGQMPTPQQQEALWGRGAPVGQSSYPVNLGARISPEQKQMMLAAVQAPQSPARSAAAQVTAPVASMQNAPAPSQEEVLQGLMLKAAEARPTSKTYMSLPAAVQQNYGIEGVDLANLSIGERLALRRMGVQFPAPKPVRHAPASTAEDARFNNLKAMYQGGGTASPYYQNVELQDYYRAYGAPPLLKTDPEAKKIQKFIPPVEGTFDINDNMIYGSRR